jgi:tetratricopeptide (TPR) repeat protein
VKRQKLFPLLVVAAGLLAYSNSFSGPFIFDDINSIQENPTVRTLWPIWQALSPPHRGGITVEGRPLVNLSLAINYAFGGLNVWGYHAFNLAIHILAGLTLFGVVRRTLLQPALRERFGGVADGLALATAVIWTVHPLQTESVTYVVQRAESIVGLFYLLTLYCFIRGADSLRPRLWYGLCLTACALGMASKEVMGTAPVLVLLYDRAFVSGSFREAWRRRWPLLLALAATWALLGCLLVFGKTLANASSIAKSIGETWWEYLLTEPGVILYYLKLSVWPYPLCLDYGWPIAKTWAGILPPTVVIVALLGATAWAWRTRPALGFLGAWFFLILAPTSSFVPLAEPAFEHRLYLPLAAIVALGVSAVYAWLRRRSVVVFAMLAVLLGFFTARRNEDYRSDLAIWTDTVAKRPESPRPHYNLAIALLQDDRVEDAIEHYEQAVRLKPDFADAHNNLGVVFARLGKLDDAIGCFKQAVRVKPDYAEAFNNLGLALQLTGKIHEAVGQYEQALHFRPDYPAAQNNLARLLATLTTAAGGDPIRAVALAEQACTLTNGRVPAFLDTLAAAYAAAGRFNDAVATAQKAIELARSVGQLQAVNEIEARLQLYREGRVYRESASVPRSSGQ